MTGSGTASQYVRRADQSGIILLLTATFFFTCTNVFIKYLSTELTVFQITWGRMVFHWLVFLPLFFLPRYRGAVKPKRPALQIVRSGILFCTNTMFFSGLFFLSLATSASILYVGPLVLVILSFLFLGEKVGPRRWAAVVIGLIGVIVIMQPGGAFHWAMLLPLGSAISYATYQLVTRAIAADDDPFTTMFWTPVVGIIAASILMIFFWRTPSLTGWFLLICCGFTAGAGQFLLIIAFSRSEASLLAPFGYSSLVWAALAGIVMFGNYPEALTIVGAGIVMIAGLYVWWRERQISLASNANPTSVP